MLVGLVNLEPRIHNTAYMQIAYWHRKRGNVVEWYIPLERDKYDLVLASSLFTFTDKSVVPAGAVRGGSGYNLSYRLPSDVESSDLDYSIYPDCDCSYLWFSRGCNRKCPFCIVRLKEGKIRSVRPKNMNPRGTYVVVQDNNFFMNSRWRSAVKQLRQLGQPVAFQGIDVRLIDEKKCEALNSLKHHKRIKIAWDNPREDILPKLRLITEHIKPRNIMCYVLIGYWSTEVEDLRRVEVLRDFGITPFAMRWNRKDPYQAMFARWVNRPAIFKSVKWTDYK